MHDFYVKVKENRQNTAGRENDGVQISEKQTVSKIGSMSRDSRSSSRTSNDTMIYCVNMTEECNSKKKKTQINLEVR